MYKILQKQRNRIDNYLSIDRRKLEYLLKWYKQEVGKKLIAVLVVKSDGTIFDKLLSSTIEEETTSPNKMNMNYIDISSID